jgi:hypothetical protein
MTMSFVSTHAPETKSTTESVPVCRQMTSQRRVMKRLLFQSSIHLNLSLLLMSAIADFRLLGVHDQ